MPLKLMYITNNKDIAKIADSCGVDWIFIDLEINGKLKRQGHLDTVISGHNFEDVKKIKPILNNSKLLVRINPFFENTKKEIDDVIKSGADIVMLPYFKTVHEVEKFLNLVEGRAKTCLLLETPEAVEKLEDILKLPGIDYIHIGLNDLYLGYKMRFMFEPLANGIVEKLCEKINKAGIKFGFGGIARLGQGLLSAELILAEHYRLKSEMVILSRSFCNLQKLTNLEEIALVFKHGLNEIRNFEKILQQKPSVFYQNNKQNLQMAVKRILKKI